MTMKRLPFCPARACGIATFLVLVLALTSSLPAQAPGSPAPSAGPAALLIKERHPLSQLMTGVVPTSPEAFQALAAAGYRTLVDLRSTEEVTAATWTAAEDAGLRYRHIPVGGEEDLNLGTARKLDALLRDSENYPIVVACASGNRAAALLAMRAFWLGGASPQEALALGQRAGLTRLEPSVRLLLGLPPAPEPHSSSGSEGGR
jgi:protein tyrosine phosphatase (PTP) superfamily phosphohydrolase (DUF442 family)